MTRTRKLAIVVAAGLVALIAFSFYRPDIDAKAAARIADQLLTQYHRGSGDSLRNFSAREDRIWADGWEFRWRYRPCPQAASLRVWISRDGRRASYAELPDCAPQTGVMVNPLKA
jgi:hypothetical protein